MVFIRDLRAGAHLRTISERARPRAQQLHKGERVELIQDHFHAKGAVSEDGHTSETRSAYNYCLDRS